LFGGYMPNTTWLTATEEWNGAPVSASSFTSS
jgi:hypothetical protein